MNAIEERVIWIYCFYLYLPRNRIFTEASKSNKVVFGMVFRTVLKIHFAFFFKTICGDCFSNCPKYWNIVDADHQSSCEYERARTITRINWIYVYSFEWKIFLLTFYWPEIFPYAILARVCPFEMLIEWRRFKTSSNFENLNQSQAVCKTMLIFNNDSPSLTIDLK